jgi:hypothetical protein
VPEVVGEDLLEMAPTEDEGPIEALSADGPNGALGEGVRPGRSNWGPEDPDTFGVEHFVEAGGELRVTVSNEEADRSGALSEIHAQVCGLAG